MAEHGPDKRQVRRNFGRASPAYDRFASLQREVRERLLAALDGLSIAPRRLVDIGTGTGHALPGLGRRYPKAERIALDLAPEMAHAARRQTSRWRRWRGRDHVLCADAEALPLADASCDLLFSSLAFQWCGDLTRLFGECRRVLRPGGLLHFATFGPDTLHELRTSWQTVDPRPHLIDFHPLHAIGDAVAAAGFANTVVDVDRLRLDYPDVASLMADLKGLGARNAHRDRPRGLTTRTRLQAMTQAYETLRTPAGLPASYEVIYGHAWAAEPHPRANLHEQRIDIEKIGGRHR